MSFVKVQQKKECRKKKRKYLVTETTKYGLKFSDCF